MHHIQRKILQKLLYAHYLGYAKMRPSGIESNHFAYHLERLVHEGLITKQERRYSLSAQGLAVIDRMSHKEGMVPRIQPHILTAIDLTTPSGETLLFLRKFQPYFECYSFPLGKVHLEETIAVAAARELEEKSGITGVPLTHRGMVYIDVFLDDVRISKALTHVFSGTIQEPVAPKTSARGFCVWANPASYPSEKCMPGLLEIKKLLAKHPAGELFFDEFTIMLPNKK